jgi:transcriptional regulator with GAF, ATPase, and Fis domain
LDATGVTHPGEEREDDARLDRVLSEASSVLIGLSGGEIVEAVKRILDRLLEPLGVERATLVESIDDSEAVTVVYSATRLPVTAPEGDSGSPDVSAILDKLPVDAKVVLLGRAGADTSGQTLRPHPGLAIPVVVAGCHRNVLILETSRVHRTWPDRTVGRLRLLTEIVAAALHRAQQDRALLGQAAGVALRRARLARHVEDLLESSPPSDLIVGSSLQLKAALKHARLVARTDTTVLLCGETGTGKELFAQAIHAHSARARYPLISVNCVALPPSLIESELFGHERGAFTGAVAVRRGRFELADRGTLFLDEIGDLPLDLQGKLLRVLQERSFERLGASHTQKVDVRIIAATNHDLESAVACGQFREDLYYRLSVLQIRLPPLRDRPEDIPALVWAIIHRRQPALGRSIRSVSEQVMDALQGYAWPGNVRELENVIERALINSSGDTLTLPDNEFEAMAQIPAVKGSDLMSVERTHIQGVLRECDWRINGAGNAAERLGLHPNTLRFRMKKLGIVRANPPRVSSGSLPAPRAVRRP